jgi:AraC family transcriptional regulator
MAMLATLELDVPHEHVMSFSEAGSASPSRGGAENRAPAALNSAIRLLGEAGRALWTNKTEAQQCIAKAAALLQAESQCREIELGTARGGRNRLAPWQVNRVVQFVDARFADKIGVRDFAAATRLSYSHFARAFRATVGEAPYAYLIRRRIERAQEMLLFSDKPLAQIAVDCGLADQAHLTRLFRRIVGMSPGAWRRLRAGGAAAAGGTEAARPGVLERRAGAERARG